MIKSNDSEKARQALSRIVDLFRSGDVPKALAVATIPPRDDIPSSKWSWSNRLLQFLADTSDAPFYDRSKALGEREVLGLVDEGLDAVIVNPAGVLGPHDYKPSNMGDAILRLYHRELPGLVPGGYDFVDVRDVCASTLAALERGRRGERYILSGHRHPVGDLGLFVEELTGRKPPALTFPYWLARIGAPFVEQASRITGKRPLYTRGALETLAGNSRFSHEKASAELGHDPRPLRDTIRDTIDWFRTAGLI